MYPNNYNDEPRDARRKKSLKQAEQTQAQSTKATESIEPLGLSSLIEIAKGGTFPATSAQHPQVEYDPSRFAHEYPDVNSVVVPKLEDQNDAIKDLFNSIREHTKEQGYEVITPFEMGRVIHVLEINSLAIKTQPSSMAPRFPQGTRILAYLDEVSNKWKSGLIIEQEIHAIEIDNDPKLIKIVKGPKLCEHTKDFKVEVIRIEPHREYYRYLLIHCDVPLGHIEAEGDDINIQPLLGDSMAMFQMAVAHIYASLAERNPNMRMMPQMVLEMLVFYLISKERQLVNFETFVRQRLIGLPAYPSLALYVEKDQCYLEATDL